MYLLLVYRTVDYYSEREFQLPNTHVNLDGGYRKREERTNSEKAQKAPNICCFNTNFVLQEIMLAGRTYGIQRLARSFATVVDITGVKVAAIDAGQPTSSVTLLVRAGSRFESKQGVANALKNFAFKVSIGYCIFYRG